MSHNVSEEILKDDLINLSSAVIVTAFSSSDENFFLITGLLNNSLNTYRSHSTNKLHANCPLNPVYCSWHIPHVAYKWSVVCSLCKI